MSRLRRERPREALPFGAAPLRGGAEQDPPVLFGVRLQASLVPENATGSATPTFTRATAADQIDFEGLHHQVLSGEARFQGARRVYNRVASVANAKSEDLTSAGWVKSTGVGITATTLTESGNNNEQKAYLNGAVVLGGVLNFRAYVKAGTARYAVVSLAWAGAKFAGVVLDTTTGLVTNTTASAGTTLVGYGVSATQSADGWLVVVKGSVATADAAAYPQVAIANGPSYVIGVGYVGDGTSTMSFTKMQLSDETGAANQNFPEYVSVGVLSAPYHGAGVDGVKYFENLNGNTVASNVVTEATGAHIDSSQSAAAGGVAAGVVDAVGPKGYLPEGAATQILATADIRDMTTASWTLGATMTRARTSVGADGAANSATRLTAGAVAATNIITTTITAAASSRTYSALVRRVTGTGVIRLTQDNFATNTDVTASVPADGFYHLVQLNQSQLNAVMGFKLDTNGDAIDVDFNQFEAGAIATSRMAATGAARNADVLTYPSAGNISGTQWTVYAEVQSAATSGSRAIVGSFQGAGAGVPMQFNSSNFLSFYDLSTAPNIKLQSFPMSSVAKVAVAGGGTSANGAINGVLGTAQTFDGDLNLSASISIGNNPDGNSPLNGTIRNVRIYDRPLSTWRLMGMTQ